MRLQSAIFDMDGTLLNSMTFWYSLGTDLLRAQGFEPEPDLRIVTVPSGAKHFKETYPLPQSLEEVEAHMQAQLENFYHQQVQTKPGVQKFLSLLKMEGVWMYVATNTDRRLAEAALKHAGIDQYFRGLITTAEAGATNDVSAEIYERCMRRLQSNKKDTVIFEDSLRAIRTAKAAGFRVCGVYDAACKKDQEEIRQLADYYVLSFEELFEANALE
jgi:HAD superfamily hydrolase (TIGR01509 family)